MTGPYESCVIDSAGSCTRWSHDHSEPPARRDYKPSVAHPPPMEETHTATSGSNPTRKRGSQP